MMTLFHSPRASLLLGLLFLALPSVSSEAWSAPDPRSDLRGAKVRQQTPVRAGTHHRRTHQNPGTTALTAKGTLGNGQVQPIVHPPSGSAGLAQKPAVLTSKQTPFVKTQAHTPFVKAPPRTRSMKTTELALTAGSEGASPPLAPSGTLDPQRVRFTQDSISPRFRDGSDIRSLAQNLRSGAVSPSSIPAIRVFEKDGLIYTLDNRRLWAFREAGLPIPYRLATENEVKRERYKLTTKNEGADIRVRSGKP